MSFRAHPQHVFGPVAVALLALLACGASAQKKGVETAASTPSAGAATPSDPDVHAELHIEITGLNPDQGDVRFQVLDAETWETAARPIAAVSARVTRSTMRFVLRDLRPGKLAVRMFQDEDGNGQLDTNLLGIPTEGWGFSGKGGSLGAPSFEDAAFILPATGATTTIAIR